MRVRNLYIGVARTHLYCNYFVTQRNRVGKRCTPYDAAHHGSEERIGAEAEVQSDV